MEYIVCALILAIFYAGHSVRTAVDKAVYALDEIANAVHNAVAIERRVKDDTTRLAHQRFNDHFESCNLCGVSVGLCEAGERMLTAAEAEDAARIASGRR